MEWFDLRSSSALVFGLRELDLDAVDAVHTVDEEDEDKNERDLSSFSTREQMRTETVSHTFKPYCNLAMRGFSEMKVKSLRFMVKGRGMMSDMKTTISNTRSANTCLNTC